MRWAPRSWRALPGSHSPSFGTYGLPRFLLLLGIHLCYPPSLEMPSSAVHLINLCSPFTLRLELQIQQKRLVPWSLRPLTLCPPSDPPPILTVVFLHCFCHRNTSFMRAGTVHLFFLFPSLQLQHQTWHMMVNKCLLGKQHAYGKVIYVKHLVKSLLFCFL